MLAEPLNATTIVDFSASKATYAWASWDEFEKTWISYIYVKNPQLSHVQLSMSAAAQ